jgi:hypothetical protein
VQELFYRSGVRVLLISANGTCVKKLGMRNRKEKLLATVMKHWNYTHPLGDALGQKIDGGNNLMSRIKRNWKGRA